MKRPHIRGAEKLPSHFWQRAKRVGPCWIWTSATNRGGYGTFKVNGKRTNVIRYLWTILKGPIPKAKYVLHTCDIRQCINPGHHYLGTNRKNIEDTTNRERWIKFIGAENRSTKLRDEQVKQIRQLREKGLTFQAIADKFKISRSWARRVALTKTRLYV